MLKDIPACIIMGGPYIEMWGNSRITVTGSNGICEYKEGKICIICEKYTLCIEGRGLNIAYMSQTGITVEGVIEKASFCR